MTLRSECHLAIEVRIEPSIAIGALGAAPSTSVLLPGPS